MKILFLPNWTVHHADADIESLQEPDKYIKGKKYWFFKYFPEDTQVDIIDIRKKNLIHRIEKKIKVYVWQAILAFRADNRYDIVISHGAQSGLVYSLLRTITKRKSPKHVIFDIGGMNGARENKIENNMIAFALKSNPYIICHSKIIIENIKKTYKSLLPQTSFIPFGVNPDEFKRDDTIETEDYVFSFGAGKRDYDTLLGAWQSANKENNKLKIAGINTHRLQKGDDSVVLLGYVSVNELKLLIQKSKFVVIPLPVFNYSYGQMSFLQSMCLGKTVVVTQTPSSVDYLENENGAFFVKPYNVNDLKDKMELLLSNMDLLAENNKKARTYITANFTEKRMGENIYEYINTSMNQKYAHENSSNQ
jgi:glycosyltransferase involved in cell wall biosynthesis